MVHVMTQNMENKKNMVQVLPVAGCGVGPPAAPSSSFAGHRDPVGRSALLRPLQVWNFKKDSFNSFRTF